MSLEDIGLEQSAHKCCKRNDRTFAHCVGKAWCSSVREERLMHQRDTGLSALMSPARLLLKPSLKVPGSIPAGAGNGQWSSELHGQKPIKTEFFQECCNPGKQSQFA